MSPIANRAMRRIQQSEARRARRRERIDLSVHTFAVGDRRLDVVGGASIELSDDCPVCSAMRTLEEYEAAGPDATPELAERARTAMALLSGDIPWPDDDAIGRGT